MYPPRAKNELPKYNESDEECVAWLNKAKEYFDIYTIMMDEEKVKYASMHLEGHAYNWYKWGKGDIFSYTWKLFKNDFKKDFKESLKMNSCQSLLVTTKRKQRGIHTSTEIPCHMSVCII